MQAYSLYQLNEYIRRVIALNFREPLWIEAELVQSKESKGAVYLDLIEKDEITHHIKAQASAIIWYKNLQFLRKKLGEVLNELLQAGTKIRIKCKVGFNERYGLKLFIEDIDPNYTFGQLELNRQRIIEQLMDEKLFDLNKQLPIPHVIQRLAVISSQRAAGYQDFVKQLENNIYGYRFSLTLFDSAVQGNKVESDTLNAIEKILLTPEHYDAVIIIRGGGGKIDLAAYDNYAIAKAIGLSSLPFIIGIGHDIDTTITDMVAALSVKTPTAVADFLIEKSLHFESSIEANYKNIIQLASRAISGERLKLMQLNQLISESSKKILYDHNHSLLESEMNLYRFTDLIIQRGYQNLEKINIKLELLHPKNTLNRGYVIIEKRQERIKSVNQLATGDRVTIHVVDGSRKAIVD